MALPKRFLASLLLLIALNSKINYVQGASVMSVDLGSEWMKVGVIAAGVPMEIALNKESKRKTPTYIGFKDNERLFGDEAISLSMRYPSKSFGYLTDLIGKTIDNPVVQLYKARFPYHNIESDPVRKTVVFRDGDVTYTVEELIAQILEKAKEFAQDYTGQQITETVIVVPGYFGQAERSCLLQAAKLTDLKILQLINDYTAVALNYGIFRRKEINETAQYFVFFDVGAYKTSASVVSYQLIRDKTTKEILPALEVLGVAYDRVLGGLEMQLRLRDHLAKKFNEMKKTPTDVFTNARAMAKLFKEAGRVKNILSANTEIFAQIEGLLEEHDFKVQVTRDEFEQLCEDLFGKVAEVFERALAAAGLSTDVISQVVLFGGNTRVPKIQQVLKDTVKKDLSKNINSDEAAAMGALYKGADLTTGFKVKKFVTKDAVLFPIQVVFDREGESGNKRQVRRTLFGKMNSFPQKKVITFNKNFVDFTFEVNYAELEYLGEQERKHLGSLNLSTVELAQVAELYQKHSGEGEESKGIKAHFNMDDSGMFHLVNTEFVFEKTTTEDDTENAFQKLSNTISKLFTNEDTDTSNQTETSQGGEENKTETSSEADNANSSSSANENDVVKNITEKIKVVTVKEELPNTIKLLYVQPLEGEEFEKSVERLKSIQMLEYEKKRKENALNALESFVIEAQLRFDSEEYKECASEKEIEDVLKACSTVSEWIYEDGVEAEASVYESKLADLKELTNEIYGRHWEHKERPEALNALKSMINGSQGFLETAKNLTKLSNPDKDVFSDTEIENLNKAIKDTIEWYEIETLEQEKLKQSEPVRLTVKSITDKMSYLDREVKYLVNKIKLWRPKTPKIQPEKTNDTSEPPVEEAEIETTQSDTATGSEPETPDADKSSKLPLEQEENKETDEQPTSTEEPHEEL